MRTRDTDTERGKATYADMAVHDERYAEDSVEDRVGATRGRECRGGERDEPGGEQALECPVVRAVRA